MQIEVPIGAVSDLDRVPAAAVMLTKQIAQRWAAY